MGESNSSDGLREETGVLRPCHVGVFESGVSSDRADGLCGK